MAAYRALPSIQRLLQHPDATPALADALRAQLAYLRTEIAAGRLASIPTDALLVAKARDAEAPVLRRVINATGIVVHTNLGRAPLADAAIAAVAEAAQGCNLEYDLTTGKRGHRGEGAEALLCRLTGAQAALAVNNNAAALLLTLTALAGPETEIIVSRGELVEIGGGFRVPDIIAGGGARLVEVGTTNRTRLADYAAAITPRTRMLLKVHQSNFRMVGFTEETSLAELAGLARAHGVLLLDDVGSGTLARLPGGLAPLEPTVRESLAAGSDLVAFSGDKLLGGPQAGLLAGREAVVARLRRHPLMRALRLDKMALAALEATLRLHADPARTAEIPVLRMLAQSPAGLRKRAEALCGLLGDAGVEIVESVAPCGRAARCRGRISRAWRSAWAAARRTRWRRACGRSARRWWGASTRVRFLLDMLTVADGEIEALAASVRQGLLF